MAKVWTSDLTDCFNSTLVNQGMNTRKVDSEKIMNEFDRLIKGLKYNHYKENRKRRPDILPAEWVKYYGEEDVKIFEKAYLTEIERPL